MTPRANVLADLNWATTAAAATAASANVTVPLNVTFSSPNGSVTSTSPTDSLIGRLINSTNATASTTAFLAMAEITDQCADQIIGGPNSTTTATTTTTTTTTNDEHLYVHLSTFWYCFLAFITSLGLVVSLVSNMIIIYLFTGTPSLRKNPSNIIAVNLSLSDLLYCLQWPSVIYCSLTQSTWLLEIEFVCQTFGFITLVTASASILTVLAMSIERAIVIRYSFHMRNRFAMRHAWLVLLIIWCTSLAISLPPLFGTFNKYTLDPSKTSCTLDYMSSKPNYKLYTLVLYFAYWIVPTIIITICYALIIRTFGSSSRSLTLASGRRPSRPRTLARARQQPAEVVDTKQKLGYYEECQQRQTRLSSSVSSDSTSAATCAGSPPARPPNAPPLKSTLSLRLHGRIRPSRLRDSIRLHNFMGSLAAAPASRRPRPIAPSQVVPLRHHLPTTPDTPNLVACRLARQVSADDEQEREAARIASLSLCKSSTFEDVVVVHAAGNLSVPSSSTASVSRHDMHQVDSIVAGMSPLAQRKQQQQQHQHQQQHATKLLRIKSASWCWQKFAANFHQQQAGKPVASANWAVHRTRSGKFSFDASARSKTCYELSSLRSSRGASGTSGTTTTNNNNESATSSTQGSVQRAATSTRTLNRARLRSISCHFGGASAHLSRTSMQIRLAKMSFYLILLWLVSWTPIASLAMINSLVKCHHRASALAVFLANTMTKLGPAFDVFIYGISHPKIKRKFRQIIKWLFLLDGGGGGGGGGDTKVERDKRADSIINRNASIRSKCHRPNASLAVY